MDKHMNVLFVTFTSLICSTLKCAIKSYAYMLFWTTWIIRMRILE